MTDFDVSQITATTGMVISGAASDDLLGYSVSQIGDFNGDGHPDVIVGAPGYFLNSFLPLKGKAYVIYGGKGGGNLNLATFTSADGIMITGANSGDQCGISVSGAGGASLLDLFVWFPVI
jgi:hypothetical protein